MPRLTSRAADVEYPVTCEPPVNAVSVVSVADRPSAVNSLRFSRTFMSLSVLSTLSVVREILTSLPGLVFQNYYSLVMVSKRQFATAMRDYSLLSQNAFKQQLKTRQRPTSTDAAPSWRFAL